MRRDFEGLARALIGRRFRPQGRDANGLDCLGLVIACFELPPDCARRNYALRGDHCAELQEGLGRHFRRIARTQARPGDLLLLRAGPDQLHLAVKSSAGFVHADARLRKVVETPGAPVWPIIAVYRRRTRPRKDH